MIDDEIFRRTEQSIADGRCPHVRLVDKESLRETSVYSVHVAVAVDNKELESGHGADKLATGIFDLSPNDIACLKQTYMKPTTYLQLVSPFYGIMLKHSANSTYEKLLCRRSLEKADHIVISKVSYPKLFLHPMDRPKLDRILDLGGAYYKQEHMEQIIVYAVKNDVTDLHKTLRDCIKGNPNHTTLTSYFTRSAIAYNRPGLLTTIIETELKDNANGPSKVGPEGFVL